MAWKVGKGKTETISTCSRVTIPTVYLEPVPTRKIVLLMEDQKQEWFSYLVGKEKEGNYFIEDIVIPPHASVGGASAEAEPFHIPEGCIGVGHSHHTMGAFHSGTDDSHVDRNYPISLTFSIKNKKLDISPVFYVKTPCGHPFIGTPNVKYVQPKEMFDEGEFLKESRTNIHKNKTVPARHGDSPSAHYFGGKKPVRYHAPAFPPTEELYSDGEGGFMSKSELDAHLAMIYGEDKDGS